MVITCVHTDWLSVRERGPAYGTFINWILNCRHKYSSHIAHLPQRNEKNEQGKCQRSYPSIAGMSYGCLKVILLHTHIHTHWDRAPWVHTKGHKEAH